MKKDDALPAKRPLKRLFFLNYLAIAGLLLATLALALLGTDWLMNRFFDRTPDFRILSVDPSQPFGGWGEEQLDRYGGWLELVDESGNVAEVRGHKEDGIVRYSREELFAKLDLDRRDDPVNYHAYPVQGPDGKPYTLIWKVPERMEKIETALLLLASLFAGFLLIALFAYTRFSVTQIKKPLRQIVEGIREMEQLHYGKRLTFTAEMEFAEIRDALNRMAERLQQASDEKEEAERNKRNMLLHLSHDLKTPVTSIYGYSQLLLENPDTEEEQKHKYIRYIHDKSSYMSKLIRDLFELAGLDDPQMKLRMERTNLTKWLQGMLAEFYPEIERKGFGMDAQVPERPIYAMLDKVHMSRVAANLLYNSLAYNPAGTVLYASCELAAGRAVIRMGDNGAGIQEPIREHVFEEFVRGAGPVRDSTGLGLAICRKIVALHGGTIELEEDERYRTLFRISLPCEEG